MIEQEKSDDVSYWLGHIEQYEKDFYSWQEQAKKIVKLYRNNKKSGELQNKSKYNILWSNVQTLLPALYDRAPTANIDRRLQSNDGDKLGTISARVLEAGAGYYLDADSFNDIMRQVVLDRLLAGRGQAWVRYEPVFTVPETPEASEDQDDLQLTDDVAEELESENIAVDYVHWCDYGHTYAKTWQEVRAVWRVVPMSRKEIIARFGEEIGSQIHMDSGKKDKTSDESKRCSIYEIWDKDTKRVYWLSKSHPDILDVKDDPLRLTDFFPCPKPVYASLSNDDLIPTPDYIQYQAQAVEVDNLTARINLLIKAIRIAGVYDASAPALARLLSEETENKLVPVDQWALFGEKGGLKGVIDFLPIDQVAKVLTSLYEAREKLKQDIYELTGISDVIRGATNPNETLGAQQLKGKYAGLRIGEQQKDVARFSRDLVRIISEIIANHFSIETLREISGIDLFTAQEKQMTMISLQQAMAQGQQPPEDEALVERMQSPTWEEIDAFLKDAKSRRFRVSIETDSTIKQDQDAEKQARTEFLSAAGGFIQQAVQVPNPDLAQLLMQMLKFGIKGFKISREMESTFDKAMADLEKKSKAPQPQPQQEGNPSELAALELEKAKMEQDGQFKQAEMALKAEELKLRSRELDIEEQKILLDAQKMKIEALTPTIRGY